MENIHTCKIKETSESHFCVPLHACSDAAIPTMTLIMGGNLLKGETLYFVNSGFWNEIVPFCSFFDDMVKEKSFGKWDRFERIKHSSVEHCGDCSCEIYFAPCFGYRSCESSYTFESGAFRFFVSVCASASICTSTSHEYRYLPLLFHLVLY